MTSKGSRFKQTKLNTDLSYRIIYKNENEFNKLSRALKIYNMVAYKEFIFDLTNKLKSGILVGKEIEENVYQCILSSDRTFEFVYGPVYFVYKVEGNKIILLSLEPEEMLREGHKVVLPIYKGVPIVSAKDRFKVDLYYSLYKDKEVNW